MFLLSQEDNIPHANTNAKNINDRNKVATKRVSSKNSFSDVF